MDMFAKHQLKAVKIYFDSEKITILRERISVVTSLFLLSFPPTILHIYTVRAIWWFLSSLLCNYCDSPANNMKLFLSEEKKSFLWKMVKVLPGNDSQKHQGKGQKWAEFISWKPGRIDRRREWNWLSFSILFYWYLSCSVTQMIKAAYSICFDTTQVIRNHVYCACTSEWEWDGEGRKLWAYMHGKYNFIFQLVLQS